MDADAVVAALNGFDVQGRKLRVEYKKVLQAGEKERIEREKALRRMRSMQLEKEQQAMQQQQQQPPFEDYGTVIPPAFTPSRSFSGTSAFPNQSQYSPPPVPALPTPSYNLSTSPIPSLASSGMKTPSTELDLNDPSTLEIYSRILLFKDDPMRDELAFSRTLSPKQRRVVHLVAQKLGVYHYSVGEGEERYAVVTRIDPAAVSSLLDHRHQMILTHAHIQQTGRQTLQRAQSSYLSASSQVANSLRMKKSMPDMKTLQAQVPRLTSRASNGNIREGYATIASPSRRTPGGFAALFGSNSAFGGGIPPVPSLPSSIGVNGGLDASVMRQPRGPTTVGFESRRERRESQTQRSGFEARSHEPLEI